MAKLSWSHSALKDYEGFARRSHVVKILKQYPFIETDATRYGNELHKAAENYVKEGTPLPKQFEFMQPMLEYFNNRIWIFTINLLLVSNFTCIIIIII
jgi:hypothetical protein